MEYVNITYTPLQDGDPIRTVWNGLEFQANKPVPVPMFASYDTPLSMPVVDKKTGIITRVTSEVKMSVVERAKQNPYFRVEGFTQAKAADRPRTTWDLPKTSAGYRSWCLQWFLEQTDAKELEERWMLEDDLRKKCMYDSDDEAWVRPFRDMRIAQLAGAQLTAAKMPEDA